jgi:hypothetical protein
MSIPISDLFFDDPGPHVLRRATPPGVRGAALHSLLGDTLERLGAGQPGAIPDPSRRPIVPIESLTYRGRGALDRALELRSEAIARGSIPDDVVHELLDLVVLAAAD